MQFRKSALLVLAAGCLIATSSAASAAGTNARSFVKSTGSDSNPCSLQAPCRNLQAAVNATAQGGEVEVLDTAGYGVVTITNSISIINQSGSAGVIATGAGSTAITINTPAGSAVLLKGLNINGTGTGGTGISFIGSGDLAVEDCMIVGFTTAGIAFTSSGKGGLIVSHSSINVSNIGINFAPTNLITGKAAQASIVDTAIKGNTTGIQVLGDGQNPNAFILALIQGGSVLGNTTGINVQSNSGSVANVTVRNELVQANNTGLTVTGTTSNVTLTLAENSIIANSTPITVGGSAGLFSYSDNYVRDNQFSPPGATTTTKY